MGNACEFPSPSPTQTHSNAHAFSSSNHTLPRGPTWRRHNCCHGKAIPDPFGHGDDVGQDAVGLEAPEVRAQPSKSRLHLKEANPKSLGS